MAGDDSDHAAVPDAHSRAAYLTWEDLTVVLPSYVGSCEARTLVRGINGYAMPGHLLAIMGPSGSGKSTLLDALAGRLSNNVVMTGSIKLNGKKTRMEYGEVAYVTQENSLLGTLTVRETISYSACLRLPADMTAEEVRDVVKEVMWKMGLMDCADGKIGNWHLRGISNGEKKRLSIALEVVTRPRLLFLDEPTSGLDSASALFVTATLKQMAADGMTVVSSIHQPSGEVFSLFGDLCLLSGGEMIYFGDAKAATQFFQEAGFPCPTRRNPSDHFLRCINTNFDQVFSKITRSRRHCSSRRVNTIIGVDQPTTTSTDPLANMQTSFIKSRLLDYYQSSQQYSSLAQQQILRISSMKGLMDGFANKGSQSSWWRQIRILTVRSFKNMSRDLGYYWLRIATYVLVSLCVGSVFFDVGTSYASILARSSSAGFVFGFMSLMSMGGFPSFIEEMKVFHRERLNGHYGVGAYVISNYASSFPFLLAVSLISSVITYFMVGLRPGFSHFLFFAANLYSSIAVVESVMMIISAFVPNFLMGVGLGAGVLVSVLLSAGFVRVLPDLPKPVWRYPVSYLSFGSWALQGQYKNDMLGLEFDALDPDLPKLQGEYVIRESFGVRLDHSKWLDLSIIFVMIFVYRFIFFAVLKLKERASPLMRLFYVKMASCSSSDSGEREMYRTRDDVTATHAANTSLHPIRCSGSDKDVPCSSMA